MSKILYIGLDYFHYPQAITKEIKSIGYDVDYYPIEPRELKFKTSRYFAKKYYRYSLDKYHQKIVEETKNTEYCKVFFITSHFISIENLNSLKNAHPKSDFIAYHWDSINQYNFLDTVSYFDKVYSFDRDDCQNYGFNYLPLFASNIYSNSKFIITKHDIDIYTVGTIVKPERYILVNKIREYCIEKNISHYFYLKVTPITYLKLIFKGIIPKKIFFKPITMTTMESITSRSKAVLDVTNNKQSGLSMRVIENINIGKKIITTNNNIEYENFYSPDQVFILGKENLENIKTFLDKDYEANKNSDLTINTWIKKILL